MEQLFVPFKLSGERVWRTYVGGREIGRLHGEMTAKDGHFPEEWMYSTTRAFNAGREDTQEGICRLEGSGVSLKQLVQLYPAQMLGKGHVERWGATTGVLIKMIDSKERLTIQVHPDKEKAMSLFNSQFGKTECWYILGTRADSVEPPCIYLGFKEGITKSRWIQCFEEQDYDAMLNLLNRIEVRKGETYLVKGGVPHAIGSGCMIIEIQEPTDYTIRVEKVTPSGFVIDDKMCHQGLGFKSMFDCFDYHGMSAEAVRERYCIRSKDADWEYGRKQMIVGYEDTPCFQIERLDVTQECHMQGEGIFSCLYVLSGQGILRCGTQEHNLERNGQFFIPAISDPYSIKNTGREPICLLNMKGPC